MLVLNFPTHLQDLTSRLGRLTMHAPIWKQSDLKCHQHLGKDLLMGDLQLLALHGA